MPQVPSLVELSRKALIRGLSSSDARSILEKMSDNNLKESINLAIECEVSCLQMTGQIVYHDWNAKVPDKKILPVDDTHTRARLIAEHDSIVIRVDHWLLASFWLEISMTELDLITPDTSLVCKGRISQVDRDPLYLSQCFAVRPICNPIAMVTCFSDGCSTVKVVAESVVEFQLEIEVSQEKLDMCRSLNKV